MFNLETALIEWLESQGLVLGGWSREKWNSIRVVFAKKNSNAFFCVNPKVSFNRKDFVNADALDYTLFNEAVWLIEHHPFYYFFNAREI